MPRHAAPVAVAAALLLPAAAAAAPLLLPGRMGFNALPALQNEDPVVPPGTRVELGGAAQWGATAGDSAFTPTFRLVIPFAGQAAAEVEGAPLELWRTTAATQARLGAQDRGGLSQADVRFGGRYLLRREEGPLPALGVRFMVKTTTGKAVASYRFTDAPAYVVDTLLGKDLGALGPVRLRALAKLGFLAWQVEPAGQDDALDYGATLRAAIPAGSLSVEWRGYAGWRGQDHPEVLGVTAGIRAWFGTELLATVNAGLTPDAPATEARLAIAFPVGGGAPDREPAPAPFEPPHLARADPPTPSATPTSTAIPDVAAEPIADLAPLSCPVTPVDQAPRRNRATTRFSPTASNRTVTLASPPPPSLATTTPSPSVGWTTRAPREKPPSAAPGR